MMQESYININDQASVARERWNRVSILWPDNASQKTEKSLGKRWAKWLNVSYFLPVQFLF